MAKPRGGNELRTNVNRRWYAPLVPIAQFGPFELDNEANELRRHGRLVALTGQPLQALRLLVSRPGEIVTRDHLRRHIWGDSRYVDFDRSLNFCIAAVRRALGDSARHPRFVETIPRQGYRFLADVRRYEGHEGTREAEARPGSVTVAGWLRTAAVLGILCLAAPATATRAHTRLNAEPAALAAFTAGWSDATQGVEGQRRSIYRFREAVRLDPRFAEAHYALAGVYLDMARERTLPAAAALTEARDAALRALALEDVPDTHNVLGVVRLLRDYDWTGARRELERSLAAEPASDVTLIAYARLLSAAGEDAGAIAAIDRAETLSPACDLVLWESALIRYRARRHAEALDKTELARDYGPPGGVDGETWRQKTTWLTVLIRADQGAWDEAADAAAGLGQSVTASGTDRFVRAAAREAAGKDEREGTAGRRPMWVATLYALGGDPDRALAWLERAARDRDPELVFALRNPAFEPLASQARFRAIRTLAGMPR
jgi:DNA-binding winged helix-turn-helix (wHTH) protein